MSKVLKVIGTIAGAVALVAGTIATGGIGGAAFAATAGSVATYARLAAGLASIGAALTAKAPPARGSVTRVVIAPDTPMPYVMGEGLFAGVLRHDTAYGATLKKVPNPYRWMPIVYSGGGPIESITPYVDQAAISSYYSGFLYTDTQLGACPESDALTPFFSGAPGWGAASKLSGKAAIGWNLKFDKDGKVFAAGIPQFGAYGKWVKAYDPRKDDTFPGGSGAHRLGTESTYEWTENPALHAGTYCYGRYQNGKRVMGIGLPADAIDWNVIAAWANACDLNNWTIFGAVYEPGDRWQNLRDIAIAGGGEPVFAGAVLSFKYAAPKIALDTIAEADLADDDASVTSQASWRDRINTIIPKYRSPAHKWELVDAEPVQVSSYVTEDGEEKVENYPFNFVKDAAQAEQLAAYRLVDGRELQPITLTCGPRMFAYRPGECLHIDLPFLELDTDAVIVRREFDPARMAVTFTLIGETAAKHAFALGKTGSPPPTPALGQTAEDRDDIASEVAAVGVDGLSIAATYPLIVVACDANGTPKAGTLPVSTQIMLYEGDTDVAATATYGLTTSNCTVTDDGAGQFTLTALSADSGYFDVAATVGVKSITLRISCIKVKDGSAAATQSGAVTINNTATYTGTQGGPFTLPVGPSGTVSLSAYANYEVASSSATLIGKWQYRTTPGSGSWVDVGTETTGDTAIPGEPAGLIVFETLSGPTSAANWEFQFLNRKTGSGTATLIYGRASVSWS